MTLTWKSIDPTKVQAYNEDGRLTGIASRGFFETDWDAYLVWNIPRLYLGTWSSEELAKAAIERAAKTTLSGWKSHAETSVAWSKIQRVSSGTCILEFASFPATETCVDPDPAGGEYEVRPVAEAVRAEAQKAIDRGANNKRIAELEAENARLREALERARNWVDFSARSLGAGVSSYAVAESLHHESARISADLSASAPEAGTLNHLRALKPGWNSYGAPAIDERAIRAAEAILRTPGQAVPTVHGGVQIEWHCDGVDAEFELGPDGQQVFEETRQDGYQAGLERAAEGVQRLKRELAEARKDSARLEWFLVSEARDFGAFCEWHGLVQTTRTEASLDEWRAAIDAAMRTPPEGSAEAQQAKG